MTSPSSPSLLFSLYRRSLRLAVRFPSIKRASMVRDLKEEWRLGAKMREGSEEAARARAQGEAALGQLEKFVGAAKDGDTSISLG
jgi:hypothetical protein